MPPTAQEQRLQRAEESTNSLALKMATVEARTDTILSEVKAIGNVLHTNMRDSVAIDKRVTSLESDAATRGERRKEDGERHRNMQAALWLAGLGFLGDFLLQLLTHLHVIP